MDDRDSPPRKDQEQAVSDQVASKAPAERNVRGQPNADGHTKVDNDSTHASTSTGDEKMAGVTTDRETAYQYYLKFVRPIVGTRTEDGLRTLAQAIGGSDKRYVQTLNEWGRSLAHWIATNKTEEVAYQDDRLITANEVQKKLGRVGAIFQLDGAAGKDIVMTNDGVIDGLTRVLDAVDHLDESERLIELNQEDIWNEHLPTRAQYVMQYLSAAETAGRTFQGNATEGTSVPNAPAERALEAWFYALIKKELGPAIEVPDIQIRKFGTRRGYETDAEWLQALPFDPPTVLRSPKGMGDRYEEYIVLIDITASTLRVRDRRVIKDAYDPWIKRFITAIQHDGMFKYVTTDQQRQLVGTHQYEPADHPRETPQYYSRVTFPDPNTFRAAAVYRFTSTNR